jgi:hypothetical protein
MHQSTNPKPTKQPRTRKSRKTDNSDTGDATPADEAVPLEKEDAQPSEPESQASDGAGLVPDIPVAQRRTYIIAGQKYYHRDDVLGKPAESKTSMIWMEGRGFEVVHERTGQNYYYCCQCIDEEKKTNPHMYKCGSGTDHIVRHWKSAHKIDHNGDPLPKGNIGAMLANQGSKLSLNGEETSQSVSITSLIFKIDFELLKMLLIRWIVYCHIAFYMFENLYFLAVIRKLNHGLAKHIPGRKTIRRWVMAEFARRKVRLRREFRKARSNISMSFDLWSSPNCVAVIAINAHWIDSEGRRRTTLLAVRELPGEHSGENQACVILKVIKEYKIGKNIGFFTLDNAGSNDTAVECILKKLYPRMTKAQRERRRLRCLGHVVNLAAQTFILGKNAEKVVTELELLEMVGDFIAVEKTWKKMGCLENFTI